MGAPNGNPVKRGSALCLTLSSFIANYYIIRRILVTIPSGGIRLAQTDRNHEKRLKEAEKAYGRWKKAYLSGKISKDELKEKLRPYKYELHELNLVKLKEEAAHPPRETGEGPSAPEGGAGEDEAGASLRADHSPWKRRSSLTMEEIEKRIDLLSLGSRPSETLQMLYEKRYGEQLEPPQDIVVFHEERTDVPEGESHGSSVSDYGSPDGSEGDTGGGVLASGRKKRPLLRGFLKRRRSKE